MKSMIAMLFVFFSPLTFADVYTCLLSSQEYSKGGSKPVNHLPSVKVSVESDRSPGIIYAQDGAILMIFKDARGTEVKGYSKYAIDRTDNWVELARWRVMGAAGGPADGPVGHQTVGRDGLSVWTTCTLESKE